MPKKKLNRILIKLSGESLMGKNKFGIDLNTVKRISNDLLSLKKLKIQICVVIGGGNIFRGIAASAKGMDRASADYMGMLATVMNSLALQNSLEKLKVMSGSQGGKESPKCSFLSSRNIGYPQIPADSGLLLRPHGRLVCC